MNSQISKDESFLHLTNEEIKPKKIKRRYSHYTIHNKLGNTHSYNNHIKLNKSITKINLKKNSNKFDKNVLKEYLQFHKFGIQRKKTRKITVKPLSSKINSSFINNNQNQNDKIDCISMVYYTNDRKKQKLKNKEKPNLNTIENSLINTINNMKFNLQNQSINTNIHLENNTSNLNNSFKNNNNKNINNGHSNPYIHNNQYSNANSIINSNVSNYKNSVFAHHNSNSNTNLSHIIKFHRQSSEITHVPYEKLHTDIERQTLKLTEFTKKKYKSTKNSLKNLNFYIKEEKARSLFRTNNLYDSLDDDESDKDSKYFGNVLLPTSNIIYILDIFLFFSAYYSLVYIPLRMAFSNCFCNQENRFNILILYLIDIIYIVDLCLTFFRGYYNYKLKVIKNNTKIIIHYLKGDFFFDLLEAIPFFSCTKYLCSISINANYCFKYNMATDLIIIKILTNLKIFKMFKVRNKKKNTTVNYLFNLSSENYSLEKFLDNLLNFSFCFLVFHFFICLNIFLAKQTYPNWLIQFY